MRAPKCRLCGKQHWGSCSEFENADSKPPKPRRSGAQSKSLGQTAAAPSARDNAPSPQPDSQSAVEGQDVSATALTPAERSKRFREKDPEAYRAWNRERMKHTRAKKREIDAAIAKDIKNV